MGSRNRFIAKNIAFGYGANLIALVLNFISRTVFIYTLGDTYLGISGLFGNILGILSFAELGIGTAMNYALYKPVAEKDTEKIKAYMRFYKNAYRTIAAVVAAVGLLICPFLEYIVNDNGVLKGNEIYIYYLIYLFNTVTSYFVSYKFSLVNAEQKNYIFTAINSMTNIVTITFQVIVLLVYRNFLLYLLTACMITALQKIIVNRYLNRMYPYLKHAQAEKLSRNELVRIRDNVKALMIHKIGEISVYQTDNIIISIFAGIKTVGLVSNYNLIISSVSGFVTIIFHSATSSFGNLMVGSDKGRQYELFRCYKFLGFWVYGFCSIALYNLMSPFISSWIGQSRVIDSLTVTLLCVDFYLAGHRAVFNNVKVAGGIFRQDQYVAFWQAAVNLIVSITMIRLIGLPGVYVGTVCQGLLSTMIKPVMVYRELFDVSAVLYFRQGLNYLCMTVLGCIVCKYVNSMLFHGNTLPAFIGQALVVVTVPNLIFWVVYRNTREFRYLQNVMLSISKRRK